MMIKSESIMKIYARNLLFEAFTRNWTTEQTAKELETTIHVIGRIRRGETIYIDLDILSKALEVFNCTPNDLLLKREYLTYDD